MKVNPSIEDSFIPMEATDFDTLLDHKRRRNEHWQRMRTAREDCPTPNTFHLWLEEHWGLRVVLDKDSMITSDYAVVDEKKYLMYLLKFG